MRGPFVKIESSSASPVYVNTDSIQSIESEDNGSIRIETENRVCYDVTRVDGVKCEFIDDVAEALNNTYENDQCMEKFIAITTPTGTVGVKIKDIKNIYEDDNREDILGTTEGLSIKTTDSVFHNITEINGIHCENVEDVVSEINDTIESY